MWRLVAFLYSILLAFLSGIVIIAAIGRPEPLNYITLALSTPQNRIILGITAIAFLVIALLTLFSSLKGQSKPSSTSNSVTIQNTLVGQVSITVPAIKIIVMKSLKTIEGIKEVRTSINSGAEGLIVVLHIMINPELSVPETSKKIQDVVKQHLEEIGGLTVAEIKILVDDLGPVKPTATI